jgi:hypothetical protein
MYTKANLRKVTVEIPQELIEIAKDITGLGVESTLRLGLAVMATHPGLNEKKRTELEQRLAAFSNRRRPILQSV